jgi:GMP reductase
MYQYKDVYLIPQYSVLPTRDEADTTVKLGNRTFKLPVVPANMRASIDFNKADWLSNNGYFYILHRFYTKEEIFNWLEKGNHQYVSISCGVKDYDKQLLKEINDKYKIDYLTIDIAHGHSVIMKNFLEYINNNIFTDKERKPFIIAGNIATEYAVDDLHEWGADCVKVGIGGGHVCTTKDKTGFTVPMFSCVCRCSGNASIPIIADGGICNHGDIAKALVAGATFVMAGSMFARCLDSPAESECLNGDIVMKSWYGSASEHNKGNKRHIEGILVSEESNYQTYQELLDIVREDLQSSISYAGKRKASELYGVEFGIHGKL